MFRSITIVVTVIILTFCAGCADNTVSKTSNQTSTANIGTVDVNSAITTKENKTEASTAHMEEDKDKKETSKASQNATADTKENKTDSTEKNPSVDYGDKGSENAEEEPVGPLKYGLSSAETIKSIGDPEEKSKIIIWGADGLDHQTWYYKKSGIELDMVGKEGKQSINRITIKNPCQFKTKRGIGIGSLREEVLKKYRNEIDEKEGEKPDSLIAGTIYGGVIFDFKENKLVSIFIGAASE